MFNIINFTLATFLETYLKVKNALINPQISPFKEENKYPEPTSGFFSTVKAT